MTVFRFVIAIASLAAAASQTLANDEPLRIAVASNFRTTANELIREFQARHPGEVSLSVASTGKLYAQIVNGAPFHVLLAADEERPTRLEASGLAVSGSRFTYALGRLSLWSRDKSIENDDCLAALRDPASGRVSLANPATAPYGLAARQTLESLGLWEPLADRLVYGENVSQALQFAASGNARLGFVAAASLESVSLPPATCRWEVPVELHAPIRQQAVLLEGARGHEAAAEFLAFLGGEEAREIILRSHYGLEPAR